MDYARSLFWFFQRLYSIYTRMAVRPKLDSRSSRSSQPQEPVAPAMQVAPMKQAFGAARSARASKLRAALAGSWAFGPEGCSKLD